MKTTYLLLMVMVVSAYGQGTLIYDQSSATNPVGGAGYPIQADQPMGQSFTPNLSSVGFVMLEFLDFPANGSSMAYVNLWVGAIGTGTLLSSTAPVFIPQGAFNYVTNFFFSTPVAVNPGTTYYLQPEIQSGDVNGLCVIGAQVFNYPGGTAYFDGSPDINNSDLWFREGVIDVPEPASPMLLFLGIGLYLYARHKHKIRSPL
jgi:hypothetical protein